MTTKLNRLATQTHKCPLAFLLKSHPHSLSNRLATRNAVFRRKVRFTLRPIASPMVWPSWPLWLASRPPSPPLPPPLPPVEEDERLLEMRWRAKWNKPRPHSQPRSALRLVPELPRWVAGALSSRMFVYQIIIVMIKPFHFARINDLISFHLTLQLYRKWAAPS